MMASSGVGGGSASGGPPQTNPPRSERPGPPSGQERIVSYQPEERYWTDYLRIALPTIGLLILLGLFWWWAKELIGDDDDQPPPSPAVAVVDEVNATPPPVAPTATSAALTPEAGAPTATAVPAQTEPTPTTPEDAEETPAADDAADAGTDAADAEPLLTTYEVGAQVVTTEDVNMRTEPIEGEVVVVVDANTALVVTGEFFNAPGGERDWWPVRNEETGQEGFIREDFLEEAS